MSEHIATGGMTRGGFLVAAGAAAGTVAAGGLVRPALARAQGDDAVAWLNELLRAEYVLVALEEAAIDRVGLKPDVRRLVEETSGDDQDHTRGLKRLITDAGGTPLRQPPIDVPRFGSPADALSTIVDVKDTSVAGYNGALEALSERLALGSLAAIADVEARHGAVLRLVAGPAPVQDAFGRSIPLRDLREALDRYVPARASAKEG